MSDLHDGYPPAGSRTARAAVDLGMRRYMLGVYNKVGLGLLLAAGMAYATASAPLLRALLFSTTVQGGVQRTDLTLVGALVAVAPLLLLFASSAAISRPTPLRTGALYWSVATLVGASLGVLLLNFTGSAIGTTLAISALAFGVLSLVGYTTSRDLTAVGGFLIMGVVGVVLTLAVNLALHSPAINFVVGLVGVAIFSGLIAYDTQRLKLNYQQFAQDKAALAVATNFGALSLFINFMNVFQLLLMLVSGQRR